MKRLLIIISIVIVVVLLALNVVYIATNYIFSEMTDVVGEAVSGESVALPVLDNNDKVDKDKSISVVLDEETMDKLESKIPISVKLEVLTMLAKNLSKEDYATLMSYAAGGVNNEKFNAAYSLMRKKLSPEIKEKVKRYYAEYMYLLEEEKK